MRAGDLSKRVLVCSRLSCLLAFTPCLNNYNNNNKCFDENMFAPPLVALVATFLHIPYSGNLKAI